MSLTFSPGTLASQLNVHIVEYKDSYIAALTDSDGIGWSCNHYHNRKRNNVKFYRDVSTPNDYSKFSNEIAKNNTYMTDVWEFSAQNCAQEAYEQISRKATRLSLDEIEASSIVGVHGLVADKQEAFIPHHKRLDTKNVVIPCLKQQVDSHTWFGQLLVIDGEKHLHVSSPDGKTVGSVNISDPKNDKRWPSSPDQEDDPSFNEWKLAASVLLDERSHMVFKEPGLDKTMDDMHSPDEVEQRLADFDKKYTKAGKRKTKSEIFVPSQEPYIKAVRSEGSRKFALVDYEGKIIEVFPHRGQAMKALDSILTKSN